MSDVERMDGACPSWFLVACRLASEGAQGGYRAVGRHLAGRLVGLAPDYIEDEEWTRRLTELDELIATDGNGAIAWLNRELPQYMALVPREYHLLFAVGVSDAFLKDEVDFNGP